MKSILASVLWPAWTWLNRPEERFVYASYSSSLSTKHSVDRRRVMQSAWYRRNYGSIFRFTTDQNVKNEFENDRQGRMVATSVGGTVTGKGGNILVVDDPQDPLTAESEAIRSTTNQFMDKVWPTRLDDKKNGVMVVVMQRLHEEDVTGHLLDQEDDWTLLKLEGEAERKTIIRFPLSKELLIRPEGDILHPEREGPKQIASMKRKLGSMAFGAQYQQDPSPAEGNMLKWRWWNFYRELPPHLDLMIQSWDLAFKDLKKSDFVAGQVWGKKGAKKYLIHGIRKRLNIKATMEAMRALALTYPDAVMKLVEDKANGPAVMSLLEDELEGLIAVNPEGGKESRAAASAPTVEAGDVYLPCMADPEEWNNTPVKNRTKAMLEALLLPEWVQDFIHNCSVFPNGKNDDDVDAFTQAMIKIKSIRYLSFGYNKERDTSRKKKKSRVDGLLAH